MDADLRELRRRAEQDPAVRPALLVARVRAGDLRQEMLELAAYVGDVESRAALGREASYWLAVRAAKHGDVTSDGDVLDLRVWAEGIASWGSQVEARAALAAATLVLDATGDHDGCEGAHTNSLDCAGADAILQAVAAWLACPCVPCHAKTRDAWGLLADGYMAGMWSAPFHAANESPNGPHSGHAANIAWRFFCGPRMAEREKAAAPVRAAIRDALTAWALS